MQVRRALIASLLCCAVVPLPAQTSAPALAGYSAQNSASEQQWEEKFRAIPSPDNLKNYMQRLSARPHHVGSPYDKDNAEWMLAQFKSWGLDAHIEEFDVLFPTPKERSVELIEPTHFVAKLQESAVNGDPTSSQQKEQLPTYNAYSADGDVTGPLVYVNYGMREDYEKLERLGVSVKGAIVIARYGGGWRGIKPKVAAEHGAVGCIIYSDPKDDGYSEGDVFPKGAFRPSDGVQRGSVEDTDYPGDPLTPGVGATKDAKRLTVKESPVIQKIPVLPISYGDAQPLMQAIQGPDVPQEWRGGLPITYHVGPGPAKVHLKMFSNWDIKPVYDVIAKIPGSEFPDEWVIRGNHHDAWVNGAEDPLSGMVALMEEARSMGELLKQGWKPKRTIIFCAWDGEEPGLLGSTEWVETHAQELTEHAVMYVNSDSNGRGWLFASGSHSLEHFVNDVAKTVQDPETKKTAWERSRLVRISRAKGDERGEVRSRPDTRIGSLGDGSDYASFLDHLGVAALNIGYGGETDGGIYHSIYDDFYWYTHFGDPSFQYGRALSQTGGTLVMRMADADVLPFQFTNAAETVGRFVNELKKQLKEKQDEIAELNTEIDEGMFTATADPTKKFVPPPKEQVPPFLNFAPLDNAVVTFKKSAERYDKAMKALVKAGLPTGDKTAELNKLLIQSERAYTNAQGLAERPWFKHMIYAPGAYTGYGVKTIPTVHEPMDAKKWAQADAGVPAAAKAIEDEAKLVDSAAEAVEKLAGEAGK
ncbi:Glutamate carboxypeptidase II [Candidatus Koribacter versatilis Ellin345]|uniref:Glutamate carboxypeptidase II n=1 Tax=Koribacter versatilis (strain Ellin345) TaxID=204669 RepID=Q1IMT0_KORVE|nr:M28 family metallopeptidase [Candidatus Koribacter versatilis]ABF41820.1 Glutamate carboxypeptidase II [Candidatus Koribacter versatilis Ellin345]